jgi:CHAT domain-containing protein
VYEEKKCYLFAEIKDKVLIMGHKQGFPMVAVAAIFLFLSCSREQKPSAALPAVSDSSRSARNDSSFAMAAIYEARGNFCFGQSDFDSAIVYFEKELAIRENATGAREHDKIADAHIRIGMAYATKGFHDQALQSLQNALAVRKEIDSALAKWESGDLFFYFGNLHLYRGEYDLAWEYYTKTLAIWKAIKGDSLQDWGVANLYHNMGLIHQYKGEPALALDFYQKSLAMCRALFGERHFTVAMRYQSIGNAYLNMARYDEARAWHQKCLALRLSLEGKKSLGVAECHGNLGAIHLQKGEYDLALPFYQKALAIFHDLLGPRHPHLAVCHNVIGEIYFQKGDYGRALASFQRALQANVRGFVESDPQRNPVPANVLSVEIFLQTLYHKNQVFLARAAKDSRPLADLHAALATSQLALQLIDQIRRGYKAEAAKLFLAEKSTEMYEQAIQIARALFRATADPRYAEQAWQFAEKSRAGILLEALAEADAKKFAGIPDSLLEKERRLRAELAFQEKRVLEEEAKGSAADSVKILAWQAGLFDLKRAYENLLAHFETSHPDYFNLKYQNKIANATEIREQLLDERPDFPLNDQTRKVGALVEYFVGRDSLFIFALSPDRLEITCVPKDSAMERQVTELRAAIVEQNYEQYLHAGHQLYQTLLEPLADKLDAEHLIIVPDGLLSQIPFEALLTDTVGASGIKDYGALPFLLKTHAVSYAYSATLLLEMQRRRQMRAENDYLAYAPVFPGGLAGNSRGAEFISAHRQLDSTRAIRADYLPASKEEVLGIRSLFRKRMGFFDRWLSGKAQVFIERKASEGSLKSQPLARYRYLHFATHGFVNESKPKLSGLMLAPIDSPKEDNILYLGEIYNLNLNADLVVLSACETGLGKMAKGEGLISLGRGFLYAGAANLLVSLWQVNDASTANLMIDFYRNMLEGKSKAAALREAKLHLIERQIKYAKPYYWAPFVLMGK